jgi:hypothetical protein
MRRETFFAAARYDPRRCIKEVQSYLRIKFEIIQELLCKQKKIKPIIA